MTATLASFAPGALSGVRVLDLSRVLAGPYLGRLFCDMGADVIKIEPPTGDESRGIAPKHDRGMSALFTMTNVGKRSVCLDLTRPEALEIVLALAAQSDVLIENFRPGVIDKLGLGFEVLCAHQPRIVMVSLNGYGADSEHAQNRAYAPVIHAVTGILENQSRFSGQPISQRSESTADTVTALHGAVATLAALRVAEASGEGQHVEVPMFDAVLTTHDSTLQVLVEPNDDRMMNPIYDAGPHGAVAVAGSEPHVWTQLRDTYGIEDPTPSGADIPTKARCRREAIERWMLEAESRNDLLERVRAARLACAGVESLREALTGELAKERELLVSVDDRRGGVRPVVRPAARFSACENRVRGPAPRKGEHNRDVLSERLGYEADRIASLVERGVLREPGHESR